MQHAFFGIAFHMCSHRFSLEADSAKTQPTDLEAENVCLASTLPAPEESLHAKARTSYNLTTK